MSLTLAQARTRVRLLVDDPAPGVRYVDADVDDALKTAQAEAYGMAVSSGASVFQQESSSLSSSTAGVVTLTSLAPLVLVNLALLQGAVRVTIPALRARDVQQAYQRIESLVVTYVPRVTFPASDSAAFVWGSSSIDLPQLDKLMVAIAASELKIVDAEVLAGLETRKAELVRAIETLSNIPGWTVLPITPGRQMLVRYLVTGPDALQLVYA